MQSPLHLYQLVTVPVQIGDENKKAYSLTELEVQKLYIGLNDQTYIPLRIQEL